MECALAQFALDVKDAVGWEVALNESESSNEVRSRNLRTQQRATKSMPITSMRYDSNVVLVDTFVKNLLVKDK